MIFTSHLKSFILHLYELIWMICISKNKRYLYAANESKDFGGLNGSGGGVTAYRIAEDGSLSKINDSISYGSRTSYVTVTDNGKFLFASNHGCKWRTRFCVSMNLQLASYRR